MSARMSPFFEDMMMSPEERLEKLKRATLGVPMRSPFDSFMAQRAQNTPETSVEAPGRKFNWEAALAALAGGLSAPGRPGTVGGLTSGLAGSLGGYMGYQRQKHEDERQAVKDAAAERAQADLERSRTAQLTINAVRANNAASRAPGATSQPKPQDYQLSDEDWTTKLRRASELAAARRGPAKVAKPTTDKAETARVKRREEQRAKLAQVDDPDQLLAASTSETLEPEIRNLAFQKYLTISKSKQRIPTAASPSQVQ